MAAIAKNRRFAKIHLKIISSKTAGPTLSQVSDYRLLGASSYCWYLLAFLVSGYLIGKPV